VGYAEWVDGFEDVFVSAKIDSRDTSPIHFVGVN
jgi:hypothetical protein